ncbi:class I SAM-dependent methyltransferase [Bradyrhizobium erythrophlei]|uniref:Methyltransferase domain-containing protein n=1 Tax=Bradyrhizobium erythrophlei TaxID=1437360 RepID=A0A1M7SQ22_9BRAD|nr:class I SAM-dependent methyltransferase [Bradyrhizobium erythrophlei]SHN60499.1 Methyltransferase domain-containing protein [Bradyrhizobium erythrophlei]
MNKVGGCKSCRFCGGSLFDFVDLGMSPLCESFVPEDRLNIAERFYPLAAFVCGSCFLVQLEEYVAPEEIFSEYAYFSGFSDAWLKHAERYVEMIAEKLCLGRASKVVEIGSNDGYLLQYFVKKGISVLGVEPAINVAAAARQRGVETLTRFFGAGVARELAGAGTKADLIVANNVMAQVPELNSFVEGIGILLEPDGVCTVEFPHLLRTILGNQFDQIYHEHFSYFSALTVRKIFEAHGLRIFDIEELWTHGGSLRLYACRADSAKYPTQSSVSRIIQQEREAGLDRVDAYARFAHQVRDTKRKILTFLIEAKNAGKSIAGYGAPGKGNTLLNYCGVRTDFIDYTVDRNPYKQGMYLPGTRIPIYAPDKIAATRPDYVMILPWNLREEIAGQLGYVRDWGAKFVVPIPEVTVF